MHLLKWLSDIFFPPRCIGCNKPINRSALDIHICRDCLSELKFIEGAYCPECKTPISDPKKHRCSFEKNRHFDFDMAISVLEYKGLIRLIQHKYKFRHRPSFAESLGNLMITRLQNIHNLPRIDCVIPVPLGKKRMRERGYNQSELIAEKIAKHFSIPFYKNGLIRIKETAPQHTLKMHDRILNVYGAFALQDESKIWARTVLLIDDVFTSGTTVSEIARILKQSGAKKVIVMTFAATVYSPNEKPKSPPKETASQINTLLK